jgi:hypothetical protein
MSTAMASPSGTAIPLATCSVWIAELEREASFLPRSVDPLDAFVIEMEWIVRRHAHRLAARVPAPMIIASHLVRCVDLHVRTASVPPEDDRDGEQVMAFDRPGFTGHDN